MYGNGNWDDDDNVFSASIRSLDVERDLHYSSKSDVNTDLDNIGSEQHQVCSAADFGHDSDAGVGLAPERYSANCYVYNINKKDFYALSWEEIADNADEDEFL